MKTIKQLNAGLVALGWCALLTARIALGAEPVATLQAHDNPVVTDGPEQPIPFSHQKHVQAGLPCSYCHQTHAPATDVSLPSTSTCMNCHQVIAKDRPAIQKLASYHKQGKPVPWVRVYQVLPGIRWSHVPHLQAGVSCEACHGQVGSLVVMTQLKSSAVMGGCVDCHIAAGHNEKTRCETCHAAWSPGMIVDLAAAASELDRIADGSGKELAKRP